MGNSIRIASKRKLVNAQGCLASYMAHLADLIGVYEKDHPELSLQMELLQDAALQVHIGTDRLNEQI